MEHIVDIKIIELEPHSYHILTVACFNNSFTGNLIIDTGASRSVFDINALKDFIINEDAIDSEDTMGINAAIENMKTGILPSFKIGNMEIEAIEIALMDLSYVNEAYQKFSDTAIAGLLGSDFFVEYNAVIDYAEKKLKFQV